MQVDGFNLLLQDFCEYCPDYEPVAETITECFDWETGAPKATHNIRCKNAKRCARMAANIRRQVITNAEDQ
ncbi:MAG: hypothetical protein ACLRVB_05595 [Blautia sp.]|mgnify:CR=1 FL=1|nr:hypothetical protein [Clostridiales bacterium]DAG85351.1 MAG TPA: hypothetical protein [Caudoviricetes sp.]